MANLLAGYRLDVGPVTVNLQLLINFQRIASEPASAYQYARIWWHHCVIRTLFPIATWIQSKMDQSMTAIEAFQEQIPEHEGNEDIPIELRSSPPAHSWDDEINDSEESDGSLESDDSTAGHTSPPGTDTASGILLPGPPSRRFFTYSELRQAILQYIAGGAHEELLGVILPRPLPFYVGLDGKVYYRHTGHMFSTNRFRAMHVRRSSSLRHELNRQEDPVSTPTYSSVNVAASSFIASSNKRQRSDDSANDSAVGEESISLTALSRNPSASPRRVRRQNPSPSTHDAMPEIHAQTP